jgi:hypothetical protein
MTELQGWCFDLEGDDLYLGCTKIWYMRLKSLDKTRTINLYPFRETKEETYKKLQDWIHSFPDSSLVVGHNILGYDVFVIWKLLGIVPRFGKGGSDWLDGKKVQFVDSYYLAMFIKPDLPSHSLDALSKGSDDEKMDYRQRLIDAGALEEDAPKGAEFKFYHPIMDEYCDDDVDANIGIFKKWWRDAIELYGDKWIHPSFKLGQKSFALMKAQEYTGVVFDLELAKQLKPRIEKEMTEIEANVLPKLPPRPLKKGEEKEYSMPAKPYKLDGNFSSHMVKFIAKHNGIDKGSGVVEFYGKDYKVEGAKLLDVKLPMEMKDQADFKNWLLEQGWQPHFWNIKRGPDGKPLRDPVTKKIIETTPKLQEAQKLCPSLEELDGPLVKEVVRYLSLRNRLSVLEGWMNNPRLEWDGCTGITPTHRQKHAVLVNCPKAQDDIPFGKEFRSLWTVDEGEVQVGVDCAAGEARCEGHYTYKYDGGAYAKELLSGDIHSKNAKAFYEKETASIDITSEDFDKDSKEFKPYRSKSKNGKYALTFGASAAKLAKTLGKSESEGKILYDRFWEVNEALGKFKKAVEHYYDTTGKKQRVPAIDGRLLTVRSKHSLVNLLFQSCLGILMEYVCCLFDAKMGEMYLDGKGRPYYLYKGKYLVKRRTFTHDEVQISCPPEVAEEIGTIVANAIKQAGEALKIAVPMEGEFKIGKNWCETH